jgi:hypothetical protein
VHLAPLGGRSGEIGAPGIEDLLQDGMHGMAAGARTGFVGTISLQASGCGDALVWRLSSSSKNPMDRSVRRTASGD